MVGTRVGVWDEIVSGIFLCIRRVLLSVRRVVTAARLAHVFVLRVNTHARGIPTTDWGEKEKEKKNPFGKYRGV